MGNPFAERYGSDASDMALVEAAQSGNRAALAEAAAACSLGMLLCRDRRQRLAEPGRGEGSE
jgi:hypothetical protein